MGSFSIRDYAARMRITDSGKCWPFTGVEEGRKLPPITIPRYRWWAGELAAAVAGGDKSEKMQAAAVDEQPLSIAPTPTKVKLRATRKRSIIEIFASAPQVEGSAAAVGGENMKKEKKKWKEKAVMAWNRKRRMSRRGLKVEICASKMKKICKPKLISSVYNHMRQDPIHMKTLGKTSTSVVENRTKLVKVNRLTEKHKFLQTPNLISRNQQVVKKLPLCSILKNKKKVTSATKSRKTNNAKATEFIKRYCETTRHVSFSEKDDILGHSKMCSSIDLPQFKNLCKIVSDVLAASSVMNHSSKGNEILAATNRPQLINASEKDTNVGVLGSANAASSPKNQLSDSHDNISHPTIINSCNSSCSSTKKGSLAVMPDLNHSFETSNDVDCFNPSTANLSASCTYPSDIDFSGSTQKKGSNTLSHTQLEARRPKTSEESFMPTSKGSFLPISNASSVLTTMKIHRPDCSSSCQILYNETNEKQCKPTVETDVNVSHHLPKNQSGPHCATKDMLSNICYPMGYKTFGGSVFLSNSMSTCKGNCTGEDFIGLPLNSQGELIQTHPRTKFIGSYKRQNIELGSPGFLTNKHVECNNNVNNLEIMKAKALDAACYQRDQLHWCQNQYYPTVEQVKHGLSFAEFQDPERIIIQSNEPTDEKDGILHSTANKTWLSFHDRRGGDVTHDFFKKGDLRGNYDFNYQLKPAMQPTMRLMGKIVVVGDNNRDCHAEGRSWTNKDVLTGESHSCRPPVNYLSKQRMQPEVLTHKPCWSSVENLHKVSDSPSNFYHTTELEPRFDPCNGHLAPNLSRKNIFSTAGNKMFMADALPHIAMTKAIDEEPDSKGYLYPTIASYRTNLQQHILLNSTNCRHSQGVSCATLRMPKVQFRYHDHESPQTPLIQPPAELPQWLLHAKQQKKDPLFSSNYPHPTALSQPYGFSESSLISHQSPHYAPMVPFSVNNICPAQTSAFAINSSQPSFHSVAPATKLISEDNSAVYKERVGTHSEFTGFDSTVDGCKFRRRPTDMDDVFMNPAKRPNYKRRADTSSPVGQQGSEQMHDYSVLNKI